MDVKYLPQMPDETCRRYLFVAIDRATRWVFMQIRPPQDRSHGSRIPLGLVEGGSVQDQYLADRQWQRIYRPVIQQAEAGQR